MPVWGCYPEALPALWVVGAATGSFVGIENISCRTVVQDRDGRSFLTQLGNALRTISSDRVLQNGVSCF